MDLERQPGADGRRGVGLLLTRGSLAWERMAGRDD